MLMSFTPLSIAECNETTIGTTERGEPTAQEWNKNCMITVIYCLCVKMQHHVLDGVAH
jgi:hypothetical protein